MLVGPIADDIKSYIHPSISTSSPSNVSEEVHIIMEYSKGDRWGVATATCANRVIISHDLANSRLVALEEFNVTMATFDPTLVILSGLHMLDGQPEGTWRERLKKTAEILSMIPRHVPIHLEMATVGNLKFLSSLAKQIFPFIDSLGLNEQELVSLAKSNDASFDYESIGFKPSVTHSNDLLHWLYRSYGVTSDRNTSRLSRIHFHSLSFHVIVTPKDETRGSKWSSSLNAAMSGSLTASLQACQTDETNDEDFEVQIPDKFYLSYDDKSLSSVQVENVHFNGYAAWTRASIDYFLVPVKVCKKPLKTVGLGDAISAVGLLKSDFTYIKRLYRKQKHNHRN
jgi:ADP-dependent glucokinase